MYSQCKFHFLWYLLHFRGAGIISDLAQGIFYIYTTQDPIVEVLQVEKSYRGTQCPCSTHV